MKSSLKHLKTAFATNFVLYYKSHVAHVNTTGRNFYSDHKLLQEIYEDAQSNIDSYAEFIRILYDDMPYTLGKIIQLSDLADDLSVMTDREYLQMVYDDTEVMLKTLTELYNACETDKEIGLSNFVQDRIIVHGKFCWQLRSILEAK